MRLKAQIWVSAYIKICAAQNLFATVVYHGDDDAGTIFVRVNKLDGTSLLFVPAPAGFETVSYDRTWYGAFDGMARPDSDIDAYLVQERAMDSDLWVIEVESRSGAHCMEPWLVRSSES